jgi:ATP-dependent DNA helicase DinG
MANKPALQFFHSGPTMRQKIFCYIPDVCIDANSDASSQVRAKLATALTQGLKPAELPRNVRQQVVDMAKEQIDAIMPLSKQLKLAPGRVVGGLLYAQHLQLQPGESMPLELRGLRPSQAACLEMAAPLLQDGKIVFTEAGTGSGKSRLIAHAAAFALALRNQSKVPALHEVGASSGLPNWLLDHVRSALDVRSQRLAATGLAARTVLVCAPSIENIVHLLREWQAVQGTLDPKGLLATAVVLGRAQFVSPSKLQMLLEDLDEPCPGIEQWLKDGMQAHFTPTTQILASSTPGAFGLMADLEWLARGSALNAQDAALDEESPDNELAHYLGLKERAVTADLVFTSTAMLAMDNMYLANQDRGNLLPYPAALFVDEAHTIESIQASVAAKSLSFLRLRAELRTTEWSSLRKNSTAQQALSALQRAAGALENVPDGTPLPISRCTDRHAVAAWEAAQPVIDELIECLRNLVSGKKTNENASPVQSRAIRYAQRAITTLRLIKENYKGHMSQSPRRRQIGFVVGPPTVQKYLLARWVTTPMGMLLSGTLAHIGSSGPSFAAIKAELGVPPDRYGATNPLHPAWIYSTPTVHMPSMEVFHKFVPPAMDQELEDEEAMQLWLRNCAKALSHAGATAAGGTLVLMTSFDRLEGLWDAVNDRYPELAQRLIRQGRHERLSHSADAFRSKAVKGERPVWLATGAAWTGLDLSDAEVPDDRAMEDLLLTDLVIPNLPFGLDRTTTHIARMGRIGFGAEIVGVQRRMRQGLGRLIRREGLQKRRIWILDGRLRHPAAQQYTADLMRVIRLYLHHHEFTL